MLRPILRGAAVTAVTVTLAALTASCGSGGSHTGSGGGPRPKTSAAGPAADSVPPAPALPASDAGPQPEQVRDAFAGLQATLGDSCTPGNCAYFLGRVHDELHRLDRAMKADPKGPGHFPEPIALIARLDQELGADHGFENLKRHQPALLAARDEIDTWMQDHPDDYR
ncbi:hypothetical protein BX286_5522 [Streptomyces sp. 3211.6]|uniref:hypothetical protein n=1 Tax=Streptomyces TaxID=1883 RepID=UPI0009A4A8C6|nr:MULTISPECIES: hypothetical protein [Streptomyces]RKT07461.1 hypothetical protein BX286_5522 [Streptomyces sp. 3211.6]RPF44919.1 hypothetical protein EDD96_1463 [Streptomyces sp. Ag109_G2-6]